MARLSELLTRSVVPGDIVVSTTRYGRDIVFRPFFSVGVGSDIRFYGTTTEGAFNVDDSFSDWELYAPPRPKVKMWQWVVQNRTDPRFVWVHDRLFATADEAEKHLECRAIKRLDHTEVEVEL